MSDMTMKRELCMDADTEDKISIDSGSPKCMQFHTLGNADAVSYIYRW
jgi:hypothetical protein